MSGIPRKLIGGRSYRVACAREHGAGRAPPPPAASFRGVRRQPVRSRERVHSDPGPRDPAVRQPDSQRALRARCLPLQQRPDLGRAALADRPRRAERGSRAASSR